MNSGLKVMRFRGSQPNAVAGRRGVSQFLHWDVYRSACLVSGAVIISVVCGAAETPSLAPPPSPIEMIRMVAQNEVKAATDDSNRMLFRGVKTTTKGSTTHLYVEAKPVTAGEMIAENGRPLAKDQQMAEQARIERFINDPAQLKRECDQDHDTADRTLKIVKALPQAFLYEFAGEQGGSDAIGRAGAKLVRLNFRPNPAYQPPSRVEEVLTGMQGYILVDPKQFRLASIDATLTKEVGFGWGILGRLNPGGKFLVQQANVEGDTWEVSTLSYNFTGKLLMVKTINVGASEVFSDFQRIPKDLTFVQALELIKHQSSALASGMVANSVAANLPARPVTRP